MGLRWLSICNRCSHGVNCFARIIDSIPILGTCRTIVHIGKGRHACWHTETTSGFAKIGHALDIPTNTTALVLLAIANTVLALASLLLALNASTIHCRLDTINACILPSHRAIFPTTLRCKCKTRGAFHRRRLCFTHPHATACNQTCSNAPLEQSGHAF